MREWTAAIVLPLLAVALSAQTISKLPDWAQLHATAALAAASPADADAWVLLDRTEIAYVGSGQVKVKRYRLTKVLSEQGLDEGTFYLMGFGGASSQVKRLKGWNARPDGVVKTLDSNEVIEVEGFQSIHGNHFMSGTATRAILPLVMKGSLIAFESEQVFRSPMGPVEMASIMEVHPVRQWELRVAPEGGWVRDLRAVGLDLDLMHGQPWLREAQLTKGKSLVVKEVPAWPKHELAHPHARNLYPWVLVRFHDLELKDAPGSGSWDELAAWVHGQYQPRFVPTKVVDTTGKSTLAALHAIHGWMSRELTYKMVYLSPIRGWIPEPTDETVRKRYGDCKDLTTCFLGQAKALGLKVYPVLATIVEGEVEADEPVNPYAFNHAISAVRLEQSLGLPSEVETPQGRFLLVDPTSRFTPLGYLPEEHRGHRVMICLERQSLWVTIPERSIQPNETRRTLVGEARADGHLEARLQVRAQGAGSLPLRQAVLEIDPLILRRRLPSALGIDLTPDAPFELVRHSNPLDLDQPFDLEVRFTTSMAYRAGSECSLDLPGMPSVATPIQRPGQPRKTPIQVRRQSHLEFTASIAVPARVEPVLPRLNQATAFRSLTWSASARPSALGTTVEVALVMDRKDADFGFDQLTEGLAAWKKDRALINSLREDGLAFKRLP